MINDETLKNIENLHRLKTEGVITEDDFEKAKNDLLNGFARRSIKPSAAPAAPPPRQATGDNGLPGPDEHFEWMILPLRRYAQFKGRSTRREYWLFQIPCFIGLVALTLLVTASDDLGAPDLATSLVIFVLSLAFLGGIIPQLALQARRFHDLGWSGWLALLNFIPYIGWLIVIVLMAQPGTEGENKYGPDPLA